MIGYDLDRGGSKDSKIAPNSFLTKITGKVFWCFGADMTGVSWKEPTHTYIWGNGSRSFLITLVISEDAFDYARQGKQCSHVYSALGMTVKGTLTELYSALQDLYILHKRRCFSRYGKLICFAKKSVKWHRLWISFFKTPNTYCLFTFGTISQRGMHESKCQAA